MRTAVSQLRREEFSMFQRTLILLVLAGALTLAAGLGLAADQEGSQPGDREQVQGQEEGSAQEQGQEETQGQGQGQEEGNEQGQEPGTSSPTPAAK